MRLSIVNIALAFVISALNGCAHQSAQAVTSKSKSPIEIEMHTVRVNPDGSVVALMTTSNPAAPKSALVDGFNCGGESHGDLDGDNYWFASCGFKVMVSFPGSLRTENIITPTGKAFPSFPSLNPHRTIKAEYVVAFARFDGEYYMLTDHHVYTYHPVSDVFTVAVHLDDVMMLNNTYTTSAIVGINKRGGESIVGVLYYDYKSRFWQQLLLSIEQRGCPEAIGLNENDTGYAIKLEQESCGGPRVININYE
ncbi:MAG: hypothetical protein Q7N87_03835 [Candidatus Uhrbacteria bacterium]|nr:hypothetical protein [Candidatus Uhrbacteria bacterium]MDP3793913.1 hypothetical protein [Candidatus Uhrbacteria bacterium]